MTAPREGHPHAPTATDLPPALRIAWASIMDEVVDSCAPFMAPAAVARELIADRLGRGRLTMDQARALNRHLDDRVRAGFSL